LNQELQRQELSQRESRDALRDSERAISNLGRDLARLAGEARQVRGEAARVAERRRVLGAQVAKREAAIERMLISAAASGAPDTLRVV